MMVCERNMWPIHVCQMDAAAERKGVAGCDRGHLNVATAPPGDSFNNLQVAHNAYCSVKQIFHIINWNLCKHWPPKVLKDSYYVKLKIGGRYEKWCKRHLKFFHLILRYSATTKTWVQKFMTPGSLCDQVRCIGWPGKHSQITVSKPVSGAFHWWQVLKKCISIKFVSRRKHEVP